MATSSFKKNFSVSKRNIDKFVNNMAEKVKPTLDKSFESKFTTIADLKKSRRDR